MSNNKKDYFDNINNREDPERFRYKRYLYLDTVAIQQRRSVCDIPFEDFNQEVYDLFRYKHSKNQYQYYIKTRELLDKLRDLSEKNKVLIDTFYRDTYGFSFTL